jgi:alpha-ketoglutarate-dependent taurine dioxygenase
MSAVLSPLPRPPGPGRFDPTSEADYRRWRRAKLACRPRTIDELVVPVADPCAMTATERDALLHAIARAGFAIYRSPAPGEDTSLPRRLGAQLGLYRLDANWLADEDGISRIAVSDAHDDHAGFIPYTDRAIGWHTDGYYHPGQRRIRGMVLHCVRPALAGGENRLLDPELAYIAVRDRSPRLARALMEPDTMTIPERTDANGVARPAQSGPVFSVDEDGFLHMRYTARTRSIAWKDDPATREAAVLLQEVLAGSPDVWCIRAEAGMGLVGQNVLHDRSAFVDDPLRPRLVLRARFLDRAGEAPWRNG